MTTSGDLIVIRQALMRELETINHYQELHDRADSPDVKTLLIHLMDEEKEHVAELTEILKGLDSVQGEHFESGHAHAIAQAERPVGTVLAEKSTTEPAIIQRPEAPIAEVGYSANLTVGSLYGQPQ